MNNIRVALFGLGLIGLVFAPPWFPLIAMGLLALLYRAPEVLILGVLMDFLWLPSNTFPSVPFFTLAAIIFVWGLEPLRNELLFSK